MYNQPPQGPNQPPYGQYPQQSPPKKKRRRGLWITLGIVAFLVVSCGIFATGFHDIGTKPTETAQATHAPTGTIAQPTATVRPSTVVATPTPTARPSAVVATPTATKGGTTAPTHGTPHIGGPLSDFIGKYGQPKSQNADGTYLFYADTSTVQ